MKLYEILFSPTGGTKKVCDIIAEEFPYEKVTIDLTLQNPFTQKYALHADDLCLIAVPSFGGRVPAIAVEHLKEINGNQAKTILITAYGNRAYDDTLLELKNTTQKCNFQCVAAIAAVTEHSIMPQFGSGRPDAQDRTELKKYAAAISKKLSEHSSFEAFTVPGNQPYQKYSGLPLSPKAAKSCNECGVCTTVCPVGAISKNNPQKTDKAKCITCMACVAACPRHARKLNPLLITIAANQMKKVCTSRKPNAIFGI